MSSRERVDAALGHREPDRTPFFEYVLLPPVASQILGRPYVDYAGDSGGWQRAVQELGWDDAVRRYAHDRLDLAQRLGHDMLYVVPNPLPPRRPSGAAAPADVPPDDPVERVRLRNGRAREYDPTPAPDSLLVFHVLREEMRRRVLDLPLLAPAYAHGIWTDTDLMMTLVLEPEVAREHFRQATRRSLAAINAYATVGVEQFGIGGDFAGTRLMISPHAYREFIVPEMRILSRRIHTLGGRAINASDGDLWPVIEEFLLDTEVDGYLEIDMHAGMDLRRLKSAYGDRVTLYGNMDCGTILSFATPDEIRRVTRECLDAGRGNGGHIFCCSNAITASVPLGNYLAMVDEYRRQSGLPALAPPVTGDRFVN